VFKSPSDTTLSYMIVRFPMGRLLFSGSCRLFLAADPARLSLSLPRGQIRYRRHGHLAPARNDPDRAAQPRGTRGQWRHPGIRTPRRRSPGMTTRSDQPLLPGGLPPVPGREQARSFNGLESWRLRPEVIHSERGSRKTLAHVENKPFLVLNDAFLKLTHVSHADVEPGLRIRRERVVAA